MPGSIHIAIVNWNTGGYLRRCLESVEAANGDDVLLQRVTVVDNASTDGSADDLEDLDLPLEVIRNGANLGFAAACNQAVRASAADYLLFLNPDTALFDDTLAIATEFMDSERGAGIGICGVDVLDPDGGPSLSCSRFPTLPIIAGRITKLHRVLPGVFPSQHMSSGETGRSGVVDQVIGAFFLVRRDLFERLDGFDTRYFTYYEEVDFARRALDLGLRSYFLKEARILHVGNVSAKQMLGHRLYHSVRSRSLYARRHWPRWQATVLEFLTVAFELPARLAAAALRRSWAELSATASAYRKVIGDLVRGR